MNPKSGKAGQAVAPAEVKKAMEADKADPGEVSAAKAEQQQKKAGKHGSTPVKPYKPPQTPEEKKKKTAWIEIQMVDEEKEPVVGIVYRITLPDGSVAEGTLDEKGAARIEGIDPGSCKVTFPKLDKDAWEPV